YRCRDGLQARRTVGRPGTGPELRGGRRVPLGRAAGSGLSRIRLAPGDQWTTRLAPAPATKVLRWRLSRGRRLEGTALVQFRFLRRAWIQPSTATPRGRESRRIQQ